MIDIDIHNYPFRLQKLNKISESLSIKIANDSYYALHVSELIPSSFTIWGYFLTKKEMIAHGFGFRDIVVC